MALFRPGPVPAGFQVQRFSWPQFGPGAPAVPTVLPDQTPGDAPPLSPASSPAEAELNRARLEAARILQEAAAEAEAAVETARQDAFEAGLEEGLAAGQAEVEELKKQAEAEVQKARAEADSIRRRAEAEAAAVKAQAEAQAQAMLLQARDKVDQMVATAREEIGARLESSRQALVDLSVAAAIRLVQGHLALRPESVAGMIAAGLRQLRDADCVVRVSPEDLPLVEAQRHTLERELGAGTVQVQRDANLSPGSYTVVSSQGSLDGRVEQQAGRLRTAMQAALGAATP